MDTLKQQKSAADYSIEFNNLVAAIAAHGTVYPESHLCIKYRNGLRSNLQSKADLFRIESLYTLQQEAERLDDLYFRLGRNNQQSRPIEQRIRMPDRQQGNHNNNNTNNNQGGPRGHPHSFRPYNSKNNNGQAPMDLDNIETNKKPAPLTEEERNEYKKKGWCTFCRARDHTITECQRRQQVHAQRNQGKSARLNNAATTTESEQTVADSRSKQ